MIVKLKSDRSSTSEHCNWYGLLCLGGNSYKFFYRYLQLP